MRNIPDVWDLHTTCCKYTHSNENLVLRVVFLFFSDFRELSLNGECFFGPPITLCWRVSGQNRGYPAKVEGIRPESRVSGQNVPAD